MIIVKPSTMRHTANSSISAMREILIEPIQAHIDLHTVRPNLKVWVIRDKGEAVTRLATEYKDGVLHFEIGPQPRWNPSTMYYLIRI